MHPMSVVGAPTCRKHVTTRHTQGRNRLFSRAEFGLAAEHERPSRVVVEPELIDDQHVLRRTIGEVHERLFVGLV